MADNDPSLHDADLAAYLLGKLDPQQRQAFQAHLAGCAVCTHEIEELRGVPAMLGLAAPPVEMPAGLEERVFAAIAAEPEPPSRLPATLARPHQPRIGWRGGWLPRLAAIGATAAVVLAVIVGRLIWFAPTGSTQVVQLVAAAGGDAAGTAKVQSTATGSTIELTVHGLPAPPPGQVYVCWMVGPGDTLAHQNRVTVGSFTVAGPGEVTLRWDTAADLAHYPHLGVTLEPADGNPLHRGPKVLSAVV